MPNPEAATAGAERGSATAIALVLLLSTATFVAMKGSRVLMTLFAIELGSGPFETGLLFGLYGLFPFLLAVHAGRIADRVGNRVLMMTGLGSLSGALALPALSPALVTLFISAALTGLTSMMFVVATQNLVGLMSAREVRTRNYSFYSIGESLASAAGPAVVGFAIDLSSHPGAYALLAALTGSCVAVLAAGRRAIPPAPGTRDAPAGRAAADLLRLPALRTVLLTNGVVMTGLDLYNLYLPLYGRAIGLSATAIGLVIAAFGVAEFVVRLLIPRIAALWGERSLIAAALALACAALAAIPLSASAPLLAAASFAAGLGLGCGQPLTMILAFNAAPRGRSAEAIAMRLSVSYGTHVVIPPLFGAADTALGVAPVFWVAAALLAGGAVLNRRAAAN